MRFRRKKKVEITIINPSKCSCMNDLDSCKSEKHICVCNIYPSFCKSDDHIYCVCKYNTKFCKTKLFHDCGCIIDPHECIADVHDCTCKYNPTLCRKKCMHSCVCIEFYQHCRQDCIHVCICHIDPSRCRRILEHNCTCVNDRSKCRKKHKRSVFRKFMNTLEDYCIIC